MELGINKSQLFIEQLSEVCVNAVKLAKKGLGLGSIGLLLDMARSAKELVTEAKGVLPELADLNADESALLGAAAFNAVKNVLAAIQA